MWLPLRGYKIIGFSCQSTSGTIDLIITLWNNRIDKNGFFTVGDVSSADLKVPNDYIKFQSDFVGKQIEPKKVVSLNRCAVESSGFLPEKFKIGNPTPGKANDCTGPHILLENIVPANVYSDDFDDTEEASCSLQPTSACAANQSDENIEEEIRMLNETAVKDTCTISMSYPDGANIASNINQENARKRQISVANDYSMD